jgi:hypothetical protein
VVCVTNITGSELVDWICWHFFTITINYDSSQSMTVYDSLHSLLGYERLLFHCDEWQTTNHCSDTELLNYGSFITSRRPEYRSPSQTIPLLFYVIHCHGNLCLPNHCLANGLPLPAFRRCLPKRFLAMDYSTTIYTILSLILPISRLRNIYKNWFLDNYPH